MTNSEEYYYFARSKVFIRGSQRILCVKLLVSKASNLLRFPRIVTSNFRDMRNSTPVIVSRLLKIKLKNALSAPKIGQPVLTFHGNKTYGFEGK